MENATAADSSQSNISRIYIWKDKSKLQQWAAENRTITSFDNKKTTNVKQPISVETQENVL